jgi:hypothetical protein
VKQKLTKGALIMFKGTPLELLSDVEVESAIELPHNTADDCDLDDDLDDFDDDKEAEGPLEDEFDDEDDDV